MNNRVLVSGSDKPNDYFSNKPVPPPGYKAPEYRNWWKADSLFWSGTYWVQEKNAGSMMTDSWYCDPIPKPQNP